MEGLGWEVLLGLGLLADFVSCWFEGVSGLEGWVGVDKCEEGRLVFGGSGKLAVVDKREAGRMSLCWRRVCKLFYLLAVGMRSAVVFIVKFIG